MDPGNVNGTLKPGISFVAMELGNSFFKYLKLLLFYFY